MTSILDQVNYRFNLKIEDVNTGIIYDLGNSGAVEQVTWNTTLDFAQAGSLDVTIKHDAVGRDVVVNEGSFIIFGVNGVDYFLGRINKIELVVSGVDTPVYQITAYDHLTLLSGEESILRPAGITASSFFLSLMQRYVERGLRGRVVESSRAPLESFYFSNESLHTMIRESMIATHIAEQGKAIYTIYDDLGTIVFRELNTLKTPYILGDKSFTESYTYGIDITDSANFVKILRPNQELGMYEAFIKFDSENIRRWGHKQKTVEIEEGYTDAQAREILDLYIETLNRATRTLDVTCVGIPSIRAGSGIRFEAQRGNFSHNLWVESCNHVYASERHIMDLSLFL